MNQQAFSGGLAPPFLPLSLPSGVTPPAGHPAIAGAPHVPFAPVPNNTQSPVVNNSNKEDQSDPDQVRDGQCESRDKN